MRASPYHRLSSLPAKIFSPNFVKNQVIKKQRTLKMVKIYVLKEWMGQTDGLTVFQLSY